MIARSPAEYVVFLIPAVEISEVEVSMTIGGLLKRTPLYNWGRGGKVTATVTDLATAEPLKLVRY
jgi:hypothetical protein